MNFIDQVRRNEISRPTHRLFNPKLWRSNTVSPGEEQTENLKAAGVWFNKAFGKLRKELSFASDSAISTQDKILLLVARANINAITYQEAITMIRDQALQLAPEDAVAGLVMPRFADTLGANYPIDEVAQSDIDGLELPMRLVLSAPEEQRTGLGHAQIDTLLPRVAQDYQLGAYYKLLEERWEDCLWNDYQIKIDQRVLLFPGNEAAAKWKVITQYRRNVLLHSLTTARLSAFHQGVRGKTYSELGIPRPIHAEACQDGVTRYLLAPEMMVDASSSAIYVIIDEALPPYYEQYLEFHPPRLGDGRITDVIRCWAVLFSLAKLLMRSPNPVEGSDCATPSITHLAAQTVDRSALVSAITESLSTSPDLSERLVDFFTYDAAKCDNEKNELWTQPLINSGDGRLFMLYTPLLWGSTQRNTNIWLRQLGAQLHLKGGSFEKYLRAIIKSTIQRSPISTSLTLLDGAFKFALPSTAKPLYEDLDFVMQVGETLIIGEAKCFLPPADTFETFKHREKVNEACEQVQRKVENIHRYEHLFRAQCSQKKLTLPAQLKILPVVLLNGPDHCGIPQKGIPIIDINILATFILGVLKQHMTASFTKGVISEQQTPLYTNIREAEDLLPDYLDNPPQITYIREATHIKESKEVNITGTLEAICYRHFQVNL